MTKPKELLKNSKNKSEEGFGLSNFDQFSPPLIDEGYESDNSGQKPKTVSQAAEQALIEANQKIRELQAKNSELSKSMTDLQNQAKTPEKTSAPKKPKLLPALPVLGYLIGN